MAISRRLLAKSFADQLEKTGSVKKLSRSLAAYLVDQKQIKQADLLLKDITAEMARRGHVLAEATTAHPLTDEQRRNITATVKQAEGAKTVELIEHVDPSVIGGIRLELPGQELNATIKRRLQSIQL